MAERPVECGQCKKPVKVLYKEIVGESKTCTEMCADCPILQEKLHGTTPREKSPEGWGDAEEKIELASYIHPESLVLNFSNFFRGKIYKDFTNNYIKFITKKSYNNYIKNNTLSFHRGRHEVLEDIYKNRNIANYSINNYNAGGASYYLFFY